MSKNTFKNTFFFVSVLFRFMTSLTSYKTGVVEARGGGFG